MYNYLEGMSIEDFQQKMEEHRNIVPKATWQISQGVESLSTLKTEGNITCPICEAYPGNIKDVYCYMSNHFFALDATILERTTPRDKKNKEEDRDGMFATFATIILRLRYRSVKIYL